MSTNNMFSRRGQYETRDEPNNYDKMTKRLAADLRHTVRRLNQSEILSPEWLCMVEPLQNIATVALMEEKIPGATTSSSGDDTKQHKGSLWDKEELCVRYIIEEGKLNMLLRYLYDYKNFKLQVSQGLVDLKNYANDLQVDIKELEYKMKLFEQSLGHILKCSFYAVEALQTCDIPLLLTHIAEVLEDALQEGRTLPNNEDMHSSQEILVLNYLASIVRRLENLSEETVTTQLQNKNLLSLVIRFLHKYWNIMAKEELDVACDFMALLMDSESFQTNRSKYLPDAEDTKRLTEMNDLFIKGLLANPKRKKELRPLTDNIMRFSMGL